MEERKKYNTDEALGGRYLSQVGFKRKYIYNTKSARNRFLKR